MRILVFFLLLFLSNSIFSQRKFVLTEQQFLELKDKTKINIYRNIDSSFYYTIRIEQSSNLIHKAFATATKAYLYQLKNDSLNSKKHINKAFNYLDKIPSSLEKTKLNAYILNCDGLSDSERYNLKSALEKFQKGKNISKKVGDIIQVFKFNSNIASINIDIGNYKSAISTLTESVKLLNKHNYLISNEEYLFLISNTNVSISKCYNYIYGEDKSKKSLLDSAIYYNKKAIINSKDNGLFKVKILMNLGNIYLLNSDYENANKTYITAFGISKKNNMISEFILISYNLGYLNFYQKKYNKSLNYFVKVDSIYNLNQEKKYINEFISSNYYQTKIHKFLEHHDQVVKHSKIYLSNLVFSDNFESKLLNETLDVNSNLVNIDLKKEMTQLNNQYKNEVLFKKILFGGSIILTIILIVFLVKNRKEKIRIRRKTNSVIIEYQNLISESESKQLTVDIQNSKITNINHKKIISISIDEEKENKIIEMLNNLEVKQKFLSQDFTQQFVAKKIKTNTAYLSYVVNKRFGKTFSEYANDLKINYAIEKMINNYQYRKYTTQAIAESVGFKNSVSFSKSFSKKTGFTPTQFLKNLEKSKLD